VFLCAFTFAALLGCAHEEPASRKNFSSPSGGVENKATFSGFSWVRDGKLAGMPLPGEHTDLQDDLAFLQSEGLQVLFSLTENPTSPDAAERYGMELIHVPVKDFTAPSQQQLLDFIKVTQKAIDEDKSVGVHCHGGHGRTGTFLAAWFIHEGMSAGEALEEIRKLRPGSVETASQEQALRDLESSLGSE
jgi:atypical dual specificity phosphatase